MRTYPSDMPYRLAQKHSAPAKAAHMAASQGTTAMLWAVFLFISAATAVLVAVQ